MSTDQSIYCIPIILELEGGYVNDPQDPGGETKYGISKRAYPHLDIATLTEAEATTIYLNDYWTKFSCGEIPVHLDLWYFNACVMSGGVEAIKLLQELVGAETDGVIGNETITKLNAFPSPRYHEYLTLYINHLETLDNWGHVKNGWTNRLFYIAAL
jgi:lysozyme family protein